MHPAEFYTGIVPTVYTVLRSTHFNAERYRSFIQEHGTPALELGCGDDGPFYELAAMGIDLEGVDSSEDMVRRGRARLEAEGITAGIHQQRMEEFELNRKFASIYLAGPTFNLLPDDATALRALRAIADHLEPEGAALVPLWSPPPTPSHQNGMVHSARVGETDARYTVLQEDYDTASRTRTTSMRFELATDSESVVEDREWIIHWYDPKEFQQLAAKAGLESYCVAVDDEQVEVHLQLQSGAPKIVDSGAARTPNR